MARSKKKQQQDKRKRFRKRRPMANETQQRTCVTQDGDQELSIDVPHARLSPDWFDEDLSAHDAITVVKGNPEISDWWDQYADAAANERIEMTRVAISDDLDQEWREALFPDAVFDAESGSDPDRYVELLEFLATDHRDLYRAGLLWFLRSRVTHYLSIDAAERIENAVAQDADDMTEPGDTFYGTVAMLRLANLEAAADNLASAGYRCLDQTTLMPWAVDEIVHFVMYKHVRECVQAGATDEALRIMEIALEKLDFNMDDEIVAIRRKIVVCSAGQQTTNWQRNQLLGTSRKANHNRYCLGYEFVGWIVGQHSISLSAADELRGLIVESWSRNRMEMRDYLDGVLHRKLDEHLGSMFGFMCLDTFKAPATLIAIEYFNSFLAERDLIKPKAFQKTQSAVDALDQQLRDVLKDDWNAYRFLDRLRSVGT